MSGALAFVSHVIPPGHRSHPTAIEASRVQGFGEVTTGLAYESIHVPTMVHSSHQGWDRVIIAKLWPPPIEAPPCNT